jgi:hypothetical protein
MFNVTMNADRLKKQFHQDGDIVMVCLASVSLSPVTQVTTEILDDSHLSQLPFPDFRRCKYFVASSEVSGWKVESQRIISLHKWRGESLVLPLTITTGEPTFISHALPAGADSLRSRRFCSAFCPIALDENGRSLQSSYSAHCFNLLPGLRRALSSSLSFGLSLAWLWGVSGALQCPTLSKICRSKLVDSRLEYWGRDMPLVTSYPLS